MASATTVGTLGIQITSSAELAIKSVRSLTSSLKTATRAVNGLSNSFKSLDTVTMSLNRGTTALGKMADSAKVVGDSAKTGATSIKKLNDENKKVSSTSKESTKALQTLAGTFNSLGSSLMYMVGFGSLFQSIMTIRKAMEKGFDLSSEFVENYNLFNVSFGGEVNEALKYQYQLNDAFKVNMSESLRYQGFFNNLSRSLGIVNDDAMMLSQNLTNLTYDLASLYNTDFSSMYSKLQSGIVGQTKPLRSVGIDVTQQTLQPILYELGIDKYVRDLTQAEKVLLRYISILRQSESAHGDFARTIEYPANAIRLMKDQLAEMTRWFGTTFLGVIGKILPYLNAVIITLKEVFKWVSLAFGFRVEDYDALAQTDDAILDLTADTEDATLANENLKKSLMGFDEINNIGGDVSGTNAPAIGLGSSYGALSAYLQELGNYDNLIEGIETKAGRISERILEWLGFTKYINEETKEVTYELERFSGGAWLVVGALTALVAVPILGTIANIGKLLGFNSGFKILGDLTAKMAPLMTKLGTAIAGINPIVVLVLAVVALFVGALVQLWNTSEEFRDKVGKAFEVLREVGLRFFDGLKPFIDIMARSFVALWEFGIKPLWDGWVKFVGVISGIMLDLIVLLEPILTFLADLFSALIGVISLIIPVLTTFATIILGTVGWALGKLADGIQWVYDKLSNFKSFWDSTWDKISSGFANFFQPIRDTFNGFIKFFEEKINSLISTYNKIPVLGDIPLVDFGSNNNNNNNDNKVIGGTGGKATTPNTSIGRPIISQFADGGFPSIGQMFVARESGAELVGNIGGRTAVMNNQQIVQAVSQGVASAVSQAMGNGGQTVIMQVGDTEFGRVAIKSINKVQKNSNLAIEM